MPKLQIPSAISPQGALSGAVQAPAAQLAQTGAGQVWGAVSNAGKAITDAAALVNDYETKLKAIEDKAEMVRLRNEVRQSAADLHIELEQEQLNPNVGVYPFYDKTNARFSQWRSMLNENGTLSKAAKREAELWLADFETNQRIDTKKFINKKRIQAVGAKLFSAQQQAMLAGDEVGAREALKERFDAGAINPMQYEQEVLTLGADMDVMRANKLIDDDPMGAYDVINARGEKGEPVNFKRLPESTRRTISNIARSAMLSQKTDFYNKFIEKDIRGKLTIKEVEQAFDQKLIGQEHKNRLLSRFMGEGTTEEQRAALWNPGEFIGFRAEIDGINDDEQIVKVGQKIAESALHGTLKQQLLNAWQSKSADVRRARNLPPTSVEVGEDAKPRVLKSMFSLNTKMMAPLVNDALTSKEYLKAIELQDKLDAWQRGIERVYAESDGDMEKVKKWRVENAPRELGLEILNKFSIFYGGTASPRVEKAAQEIVEEYNP